MIEETLPAHPGTSAENVLDLVLFNTSTIATQHLKEAKDTHHANINYLNTEIKTLEAQLDATSFECPMTKTQTNYNNKLHNRLRCQPQPGPSSILRSSNQDLKDIYVLGTFKINIEKKGVSKISSHIQTNIDMPNSRWKPPA